MNATKRIALVAHDERKQDLLAWVHRNADTLASHRLYANSEENNDARHPHRHPGSLFGLRLTVVLLQYRAY